MSGEVILFVSTKYLINSDEYNHLLKLRNDTDVIDTDVIDNNSTKTIDTQYVTITDYCRKEGLLYSVVVKLISENKITVRITKQKNRVFKKYNVQELDRALLKYKEERKIINAKRLSNNRFASKKNRENKAKRIAAL